jgi:hypothetical protein
MLTVSELYDCKIDMKILPESIVTPNGRVAIIAIDGIPCYASNRSPVTLKHAMQISQKLLIN